MEKKRPKRRLGPKSWRWQDKQQRAKAEVCRICKIARKLGELTTQDGSRTNGRDRTAKTYTLTGSGSQGQPSTRNPVPCFRSISISVSVLEPEHFGDVA